MGESVSYFRPQSVFHADQKKSTWRQRRNQFDKINQNKVSVDTEYALRDMSKPIGVSEYKLTGILPDTLENQLPSPEDIQSRIGKQEWQLPISILCETIERLVEKRVVFFIIGVIMLYEIIR